MEGPGGNQPRRRAGDSNTPGNPSPIKDWQRHTWYGPVPQDSNPFDEPDEAPELLELRSDNVKQKSGEFWQEQKQQTGYLSAAHTSRRARNGKRGKKRDRKHSGIVGKAILILVALAVGVLAVLYFSVYRVRQIIVEGASEIAAKDVIELSGVKIGDSILSLDEKKVEETMLSGARSRAQSNQNYYRLQFRHLERKMPGTVTIIVSERVPCCWIELRGIIYVMDKERMVLWVTEDKNGAPTDLVQVKGLKVRNDPQGGQILSVETSEQERILRDMLLEIKVLGCMELIQEMDLRTPSSVTLTTRRNKDEAGNEYVVSLGDCRTKDLSDPNADRILIHAKLRSFLLVWEKLHHLADPEREAIETRIGHRINGGTINVKTPESPFYSPENE